MKKICLTLIVCLAFGCASAPQLATLATPSNVQTTITVLGSLAVPKVTAGDKAIVHAFATSLLSLAMADVTASNLTALTSKIPASASPFTAGVISAAITDLNLALAKFGEHNATTLAYVNAVGNGLIAAGF